MSDKLQKKVEEVYEFAPLSNYSLKQRLTIRLADWIFYTLIGLIGKTLKYETVGAENLESINQNGKIPIYSLWHNRIFAGTFYLRGRKIVVITSQSLTANILRVFCFDSVSVQFAVQAHAAESAH